MGKSVSDFEDFVVSYAQDAPSVVLQHAIRETVVKFMRETRVATDTYCINAQCGVTDYVVEMPDCSKLVAIENVEPDGGVWGGFRQFRNLPNPWAWNKDDRFPVVIFGFSPREDAVFHVTYSWTINRDGCDVPDFIYEEWMDAIKFGAAAELLAMPNQEWTNPQLAHMFADKYREERAAAKARKWHNYTQGPISMFAPSFLDPRYRSR